MSDSYEGVAQFYDLFARNDDLPFFVKLASGCRRGALELGVGTARVALELARSGIPVTGIDTSQDMLRVAREKVKKETQDVRKRVSLIEADMKSFDIERTFDLIYMPAGLFESERDMSDCLNCCSSHLSPQGTIALDIWMWRPSLEDDFGIRKYEEPQQDGHGNAVVRSVVWHKSDRDEKAIMEIFYQVFRDSVLVNEHWVSADIGFLSAQTIRDILSGCGFKIKQELGGFVSTRYMSGDERMVVVARRRV